MMKAITYKGVYSPIVKNNGVQVTLIIAKGDAKGSTQVVCYSDFSVRQQKLLARNKTCTEHRTTENLMNPDGPDIQVPIDAPAHMDPSTETYWSM